MFGDFSHFLSFIIIIYKIKKDKSCKGLSAKTFEIYLLVFFTRYLYTFIYYINLFNTLMKIFFICVTTYILFLMHYQNPYKITYNRKTEDVFNHLYLIVFAFILTIIVHNEYSLCEMFWFFSLWLESVVVLPQIIILANNFEVSNYTAYYLASIIIYKFFYFTLSVHRYIKYSYISWVSILSGSVQVLLYLIFLYLYLRKIKN